MAHADTFTLAVDPEAARAAAELLFDAVRRDLVPVLPLSAEMLHVGATSVPGCLTKGDLDIVVRVDPADFAAADACLAARFARNHGSARTEEFASFEDESYAPHLGIQLTVRDGAFDVFHLFADALRADPDLVKRYNDLKRAYRDQPMAAYRTAKDQFVADVLRRQRLTAHERGN